MKNKIILYLVLYFAILCKTVLAIEFSLKVSEINVTENGNLTTSSDGLAISSDKDIEIEAKKFFYKKNLNQLIAEDGVLKISSKNIIIKFQKLINNRNNFEIFSDENIEIKETNKNLNIITSKITYNNKSGILLSNSETKINDDKGNFFLSKNFNYNLNNYILRLEELKLKDFNNNEYFTEIAIFNTRTKELSGKGIKIDLDKGTLNKNNEPRLVGKSVSYNNEITVINKGIFTICKKNDTCPPWQLTAEKITHNKKNKNIKYDNAWLKIYDVPVLYFPKFFHPDPTVKRQSGFLIPSIKSSSNGQEFLSTPYFKVIDVNKDLTFSPRFYNNDKLLLQSEYRQNNKKSNHIADFSISKDDNSSTKNHLFYKYDSILDISNFSESNIEINLQKTSSDRYLKSNKIISAINNNYDVMESSLDINLSSEDLLINTDLIVFEDLTKNKKDRFEYIFPKISIAKNITNTTKLNGDFEFLSDLYFKNYNTNVSEKINVNDLKFISNPIIFDNGIFNNYEFIIKNSNSSTKNSLEYKENENIYLSSLFQINSALPLINMNDKYRKILKPKASLKIAPENDKDISGNQNKLDVNNIYNLSRISANETIEGGISITYGSEYSIIDNNNSNDLLNIKFANNLRFKENNNLPKNNQIGLKTSNFFGEISYNPGSFVATKYSFSTKNNLSDISYESLMTEFNYKNFTTSFDYINENNIGEKTSFLLSKISYNIDESNNLSFSTRENKAKDLTEYYNLIYQYKNDCLSASIEYNKEYYNDNDIKPEETLFFKLNIIPFGETSSPNLRN